MTQSKEIEKAQQKIVAVLARMLALAPESVRPDARYLDLFNSDPDAVRAFGAQVESSLGVIVGDSVFSKHPTIPELAAYCAAHRAPARGERLYVVVSRMPDGSTRERIYAARGHEKAAQLAMDDGAEAVLSVEREDAEDGAPRGMGMFGKILVPLLVGLLLAVVVFVFFWWRRGFQPFW
ncbi:MAG: acyl carrier protein [Kiritimatiellae bacterium]|nr:acyl carrier protein [Kiritimatiellia bacterium]